MFRGPYNVFLAQQTEVRLAVWEGQVAFLRNGSNPGTGCKRHLLLSWQCRNRQLLMKPYRKRNLFTVSQPKKERGKVALEGKSSL